MQQSGQDNLIKLESMKEEALLGGGANRIEESQGDDVSNIALDSDENNLEKHGQKRRPLMVPMPMNEPTEKPVVRSGTFLYDGLRICMVRILQTDLYPGSGDHEDAPEIREDKYGTFFEVQYTPPREERFAAGGGFYRSLAEAVAAVEQAVAGAKWDIDGTQGQAYLVAK